MRKYGWITLFVFLVVSCGKDQKAKIQGTFSGVSKDTVVLEMISARERIVVDTTVTDQKGAYRFKVTLPKESDVLQSDLRR